MRDRGNDILLLAGFFLEQNRTRLGFRSLRIADTSESLLLNYPWPGNVRELEHVVSRAAIKALSRGVVRSDIVTLTPDCFDGLGTATASVIPAEVAVSESGKELPNLKQAVEQTQRSLIRQALHRTDQSWAQAARLLGIDASNLHKLAGRLGLKSEPQRKPPRTRKWAGCHGYYGAYSRSSRSSSHCLVYRCRGLPTVPFVLLAAWAAGKGWPELEQWLLHHPRYGGSIRAWRQHGAVSRRAKWLASVMMAGQYWIDPAVTGPYGHESYLAAVS